MKSRLSHLPVLLCLSVLGTGALAASAPALRGSASERYQQCTAIATEDPGNAEVLAVEWQDDNGGLPAGHCLALALSGQGRFAEAATILDEIAAQMRLGGYFFFSKERADRELLAEIFGQAGNAWILADEPVKAYESLTEALGIVPGWSKTTVEHRLDRARALAMLGNYDQALKDLKAAQDSDPNRIEIYVYRASAFRHIEAFEEAAAELEGAFGISEEHQEALLERGILRQQTGDSDGAVQDWIKLLRRHPKSVAAQVARANLEAMDVEIDDWQGVDEVDVTGKRRRARQQP